MASAGYRHVAFRTPGPHARAGCEDGTAQFTCRAAADAAPGPAAAPARTGRTTGADVQVPKVFTQAAQLWAGCPSLVRVRVALPDASKRGRGIIRNDVTGKTVTATLLGRKRGNPGPSIQVSSDRGRVGGLAAGRPATVMIAALRREDETPVIPGVAAAPAWTKAVETGLGDPGAVPAVTGMAEARAGAPVTDAGLPIRAGRAKAVPAARVPARGGTTSIKPGVLIFGVKAKTGRAADAATRAGTSATARKKDRTGKACQSIAVSLAADGADCDALMKTIKGPGPADACFHSR
ncbi:MAG: hypothetical protein INF93_09560 [Rhodobacter sp.]|nr:hypothetical protein [Rhodobacter sp.]